MSHPHFAPLLFFYVFFNVLFFVFLFFCIVFFFFFCLFFCILLCLEVFFGVRKIGGREGEKHLVVSFFLIAVMSLSFLFKGGYFPLLLFSEVENGGRGREASCCLGNNYGDFFLVCYFLSV